MKPTRITLKKKDRSFHIDYESPNNQTNQPIQASYYGRAFVCNSFISRQIKKQNKVQLTISQQKYKGYSPVVVHVTQYGNIEYSLNQNKLNEGRCGGSVFPSMKTFLINEFDLKEGKVLLWFKVDAAK